ncbi:MAG: radical SAM protein, partial [Parvibaculaceae bacterium]
LHYVYPYPHVDEVIPLMAEGKILPYLDIPFQHAAPNVLKAMRRPANQEKVLDRLKAWRKIAPDIAIRSSFIVGFPGETEADFTFLLDWLKEARLERVGCFKYEPVGGAKANDIAAPVPEEEKEERWHRLMQAQQEISADIFAKKVGREIDVLIDEVDQENEEAIGRSPWDAPEIDGNVFLPGETGLKPGDMVRTRIVEAEDYDLIGEKI